MSVNIDLTRFFNLFSSKSKETLLSNGNFYQQIVSIKVGKHPIINAIHQAINLISVGAWNKLIDEEYGYDKLMHLYVIIGLSNGRYIKIEKNELLYVMDNFSNQRDDEFIDIRIPSNFNFTLIHTLYNCSELMGEADFFGNYNWLKNNCQIWVVSYLSSNGILDTKAIGFTYQDLQKVAEKLPAHTNFIMENVPKFGEWLSRLTGGKQQKKKQQKKKPKRK